MHLTPFLAEICLYLLFLNVPQAVEARHAIVPRQDSPSPRTSQLAVPTSRPSADGGLDREIQSAKPTTTALTPAPSTSKKTTASTDTSASDQNALSSSSTGPAPSAPTSTTNSSSSLPSNPTQTKDNELPINPAITPALSVAGAILMLTGLFYTLIGIKTSWLHIFLSTAYLASLAVTVLIVYIMHPPVSNAVQGAYFVAAFVTGVIFGGGSVVFADVAEGLGCLLGGYSLAMWFLVLKPDGLIKSTAGKAIFIACFTLGAFGFYVSHWTRAYGLIGATSFAGATVIVLGIDCFSRAGLKEFWLYIWGLNKNIFPLRYNGPYPHTRGIRVEIAATILIFLVGVMSQMKIWRIIERRREERATEHLRKQQLQDQAEDDLGRKIEAGNTRDRTLWEAAYNGKNGTSRQVDSGIGTSVSKASLSIVGINEIVGSRSRGGSIEMNDLEHGAADPERDSRSEGKGKERATVTIRVASDDDIIQSTSRPASVIDVSNAQSSHGREALHPYAKGAEPSTSPNVVPLPFNVPSSDLEGDRGSSIAASIASEHFSSRMLKRLSGTSLKRTSSKRSQRSSYVATSTSEEAVLISHDDDGDDRASSVEATIDEISDGHRSEADGTTLAGLPTPDSDPEKLLKFSPPMEPHPVDRLGRQVSKMSLGQASSHSVPVPDSIAAGAPAVAPVGEPEIGAEHTSPGLSHDPTSATEGKADEGDQNSQAPSKPTSEQPKEKPAFRASLADLDGASKVVMAYRTNEWAKHLDRAEKPSLDDLRALRREESLSEALTEKAAPLNVTALRQTPLNAEPAPAAVSSRKADTAQNPRTNNRSYSSKSQESLSGSPAQAPNTSSHSFERTSSQSSLSSLRNQLPHPSRHNSSQKMHHHHPLASPTIEEDIPSTSFPQRPGLSTTNTLLAHRQTLLATRPSSTSLTRVPSYHLDDDNVPLSIRRQSLLNNHPTNQRRIFSSPPANNNDNHRLSDLERQNIQLRHSQLLAQKRRSESDIREKEKERDKRERDADERWRQGAGMEERHREAMRRMQAGVGG
ncbi:MAG: hypothetical protein Q9166_001177 [cf. Caloplaca sp. 2 TL-2023]